MAQSDYDTSRAYAGPLTNSTEKLMNKAQKASSKDNWASYIAPYVPGGGEMGQDGRLGAFREGVKYMADNQPDLNQLIKVNPGYDAV